VAACPRGSGPRPAYRERGRSRLAEPRPVSADLGPQKHVLVSPGNPSPSASGHRHWSVFWWVRIPGCRRRRTNPKRRHVQPALSSDGRASDRPRHLRVRPPYRGEIVLREDQRPAPSRLISASGWRSDGTMIGVAAFGGRMPSRWVDRQPVGSGRGPFRWHDIGRCRWRHGDGGGSWKLAVTVTRAPSAMFRDHPTRIGRESRPILHSTARGRTPRHLIVKRFALPARPRVLPWVGARPAAAKRMSTGRSRAGER